MKKALIFIILAAAAMAHSQDLFNDFTRTTTTEYDSVNKVQIVNTVGKSDFLVGNVDYTAQVLRQIPIVPPMTTVAGGQASATTDQIFGSATYHFASGVWWNLAPSSYRLSNGVSLPSQTVVMASIDAIPTIQYETTGTHTFNITFTPLPGVSTPGNFVMQVFTNGAWSNFITDSALETTTINSTLNYMGPYKVRWMLVRTGSAPAIVGITINLS